jgi:hypothetical protein
MIKERSGAPGGIFSERFGDIAEMAMSPDEMDRRGARALLAAMPANAMLPL